ncbi:regulatory protein GemA, partial [Pseudomonas sp. MWU13-2860]
MTDRRKAMIAKIKIAQQQLQMADDSYRAML